MDQDHIQTLRDAIAFSRDERPDCCTQPDAIRSIDPHPCEELCDSCPWMSREPRRAYHPVMAGAGWTVGIVVEGMHGYFQTAWEPVAAEQDARDAADTLNALLGLDRRAAALVVASSMWKQNRR